jgi:F-type H+-transporting ATPase subunit b
MNITLSLIGQILAFAVLVWFIKAVLWEPMLNMMEARKKRIADGLEAAERGLHDKELAEQRARARLHEAKLEAAEILNQAQKRGGDIVDEAKTHAHEEGERIVGAARAEIDQEINRAKEQLRRQVAALALEGAERVLEREIDAQAHGKVLEELAAQI